MKICLVPFPIVLDSSETIDQKQLYPYLPLGLLTLSTLLELAGHEITILDPVWETDAGLLGELALPRPADVAPFPAGSSSPAARHVPRELPA